MLNSQLEAMGKDNTSREEELQQTIQQLDVSYVPTPAYLLSYSTVVTVLYIRDHGGLHLPMK